MSKQTYILNLLFTLLAFVSLIGAAWAVWVYLHTPLLIHDTMHVVGQQLTEPQRNALYPALGKAYRPIVFGGAIVVIAWMVLAGVVIPAKALKSGHHPMTLRLSPSPETPKKPKDVLKRGSRKIPRSPKA